MNHVRTPLGWLWLCVIIAVASYFVLPLNAFGSQPLNEEQHSTWTGGDGAPQGIWALAQAPNGMLWLTTLTGVYSFDGRVFSRFNPPDPAIYNQSFRAPWFSHEGDLWLERIHGAPVWIHHGRIESVARTDCGSIQEIGDLQEDPDGTIWAGMNEQYLVRLGKDLAWHRVSIPVGVGSHLTKVHVDRQRTVWIVLNDRLYRRPSDAESFVPTSIFVYGVNTFSDGLNGDVWIGSSGPPTSRAPALHLQHVDSDGLAISTRRVREELFSVVADPDGGIWVLTTGSLLAHLNSSELSGDTRLSVAASPDVSELRTAVQDDGSLALLHSQDGAIWVGGLGGLERFAVGVFVPLIPGALPGLWDNCVEADGRQWVKDPHNKLLLSEPDKALREMPEKVEALYCSKGGTLFRNDEGLWATRHAVLTRLPALPDLQGYSNHYIFTGAVIQPNGTILAAAAGGSMGRSLWSYSAARWSRVSLPPQLPEITAMCVLSDRQSLLGLSDGSLALLLNGTITPPLATQPSIGGILSFAKVRTGILVLGVRGVALWTDHGSVTLKFQRADLVQRSTGALEARDGSLWLNAAEGIVRIPAAEWAAASHNPSHVIDANNLHEGSFVGPSYPSLFSDRAQIDAKGRLWFSTLNGVVSIDENAIPSLQAPPRLVLRDVLGDGQAPAKDRSFAPNVGVITIAYTGIDYNNPTGVTYAYKLLGNDRDWQYVGGRNEAVYTHLSPGRYTFLLRSRSAFGSWSEQQSLEPFSVKPHFYERVWFLLICLCIVAASIWSVVQFRLRSMAAAIRIRAEGRADERVSIARDLHDTLLQGIQGLLLTLHAAAEKVPDDHESRHALERALVQTEKFVIEGRDRVRGLRAFGLQEHDLGDALAQAADDAGCRDAFEISIQRPDMSLRLSEKIESEILLIGREALLNACRHAEATRIRVRLHYEPMQFVLECNDNGKGFDTGIVGASEKTSRFGLRGMQERARDIHAVLTLSSSQSRGTLVRLELRAAFAYRR